MYVRVVAATKSPGISDGLTYSSEVPLEIGTLVEVPLRSGTIEGIVVEQLQEQTLPFAVKPIICVIGERPILTKALVQTGLWMAKEYLAPLRQVFSVLLPAPPWRLLSTESKSKKTAVSQKADTESGLRTLTAHQQEMKAAIQSSPLSSLLMGLPGTGKTEVVKALVQDAVRKGSQAIVLSPEILLSEHAGERFAGIVPAKRIAVIHSRLTPAKKKAYVRAMLAGDIDLVIGSRTALFSPLPRLSLIAVEEEHEWTYKHEQTPRYNTRDVARVLSLYAGAKLVLTSSTPSLESYALAKQGKMQSLTLFERHGQESTPAVHVVDLHEANLKNTYPLSPQLLDAIAVRMGRNEQSVIFLNRTGDYSGMLCLDCKTRIDGTGAMFCPKCRGARMISTGAGTQVVERVLKSRFPTIKILRADSETAKNMADLSSKLQAFAEGEGDVLLGTQTVTHGLHFPNVTLSVVVIADTGLSRPDFRAGERVFAHLIQLAGRSGRNRPGEVIIQAFNPSSAEITYAKNFDVTGFLENELALRKASFYPPAVRMARLLFSGPDCMNSARITESDLASHILQTGSGTKVLTQKRYDGSFQVILRGTDLHKLLRSIDVRSASIDLDPVDIL